VLGTLLNVKPILSVRDGQIVAHEKVRTHSRTLARLVAIARDEAAARGPEARLAVHYFGNQDAAEEIVQELAGASLLEVLAVPVPAVLGAHTGAGVMAVAISGGIAPPVPGPVRQEARPRHEPKPKPEPKAKPRSDAQRRDSRRRAAASSLPGAQEPATPVEPADPEEPGTR
jgi:hypothetical protein